MRIFYACTGGANIIDAHRFWRAGQQDPGQVSITFSSQIADFCRDIGATALMVSDNADGRVVEDGPLRLEHVGRKRGEGLAFHREHVRHGWRMVRRARQFRADVALIDSGVTHHFMCGLFPLSGIPVVPILHNAVHDARERSAARSLIAGIDRIFWRRGPHAVIAASPECQRQVEALGGGRTYPIHQFRAQFVADGFASIPPPPAQRRPFRIIFVARMEPEKGALDVPVIARQIEDSAPGLVHWTICGDGSALADMRALSRTLNVDHVVDIRGWTDPASLRQLLATSHASIVPTRGDSFGEGLAMTAVESVLAGRPVITSRTVPALELLRPAALEAEPDNPGSYADAILRLATDEILYEQLRRACPDVTKPFIDTAHGLAAALRKGVAELAARKDART